MKLKSVSENELEVRQSGVGQIFGASVFILLGIVAIFAGFKAEEGRLLFIILGSIFTIIGVFLIFRISRIHTSLRNDGVSVRTVTNIITKKAFTEEFSTDQIQKVVLESSVRHIRDSDGDSRRERTSTLYVDLNDNRQILLMTKKSGGVNVGGIDVSSFGRAPLSKEAERIAEFFGVPLEHLNNGAPSISEIVKGVKEGIESARGETSFVSEEDK